MKQTRTGTGLQLSSSDPTSVNLFLLFGGRNEGGYPSVDWFGSCPISPNEEAMFGPILANNFSAPQTHTAEHGGSGHGSSLPWQVTAQAAKTLTLRRPGFEPG